MTHELSFPLWAWLILCAIIGAVNFIIVTRNAQKRESDLMEKFGEAFETGARMQVISDIAQLQKIINNIDLPEEAKKHIIDEFVKKARHDKIETCKS